VDWFPHCVHIVQRAAVEQHADTTDPARVAIPPGSFLSRLAGATEYLLPDRRPRTCRSGAFGIDPPVLKRIFCDADSDDSCAGSIKPRTKLKQAAAGIVQLPVVPARLIVLRVRHYCFRVGVRPISSPPQIMGTPCEKQQGSQGNSVSGAP